MNPPTRQLCDGQGLFLLCSALLCSTARSGWAIKRSNIVPYGGSIPIAGVNRVWYSYGNAKSSSSTLRRIEREPRRGVRRRRAGPAQEGAPWAWKLHLAKKPGSDLPEIWQLPASCTQHRTTHEHGTTHEVDGTAHDHGHEGSEHEYEHEPPAHRSRASTACGVCRL